MHSLSMHESVDRWCDCGLLLFRLQRLQRAASHLGVVLTDLGREQRGLLTHTHTHLLEGVSGRISARRSGRCHVERVPVHWNTLVVAHCWIHCLARKVGLELSSDDI